MTQRIELADVVAETARDTELGRLQEHVATENDELDVDTVMANLEAPAGVAEVRIPPGYARSALDAPPNTDLLVVQVARPMVIVPDDGEPFCAVVGLDSDGTAAGAPADGDVADECRDAVIPVQDESASEGNPLDLWDQDSG